MLTTIKKLRKSPHCPTSNSFRPFLPCGEDNFLTIINSASPTPYCFLISSNRLVRRKDCENLVSKMQTIQVDLSFHTERRQKEGRLGRGMDSWYSYLEQGLSRKIFKDRISGYGRNHINIREDLKNPQPFVVEH